VRTDTHQEDEGTKSLQGLIVADYWDMDLLGKFNKTFEHFPVTDEWQAEAYQYVVLGYDPGSFFSALFANDLLLAAQRSHPLNQWNNIQELVKWLHFEAPAQCHGSHEKVHAWLELSKEKRTKICEEKGLVATAWDILKEPV
jgi:hypothetical protein